MAEKKLEDKRGYNGKAGYVDENGNWVIEPKFDDVWSFQDGIAKIKLKGKLGLIKSDGTYLLEPQFDYAEYFSNGFAKVKLDGTTKYVDTNGRIKSSKR